MIRHTPPPTVPLTNSLTTNGATLLDHVEYSATVSGSTLTLGTHDFQEGDALFLEADVFPSPAAVSTRYYAKSVTATTLQISTVRNAAALTLTTTGTNVRVLANSNVKRKGALTIGRGNLHNRSASDGCGIIIIGNENTFTWSGLVPTLGHQNKVSRPFCFGSNNTVTNAGQGWFFLAGYDNTVACGASGATTVILGDQHGGGGHSCAFLGGFHNVANTVGTTDGLGGAITGVAGAGTICVGMGGVNIALMGAGVLGNWQGFRYHTSHGNKDVGQFDGTLMYKSNTSGHMLAAGATRANEMLTMDYRGATVELATGVDIGTDTFTSLQNHGFADGASVYICCNDTFPGGLVQDQLYTIGYVSATEFTLKIGGSVVNVTNAGAGQLMVFGAATQSKWLRTYPNRLYTFEVDAKLILNGATTPTWAVYRRRLTVQQGAYGTTPVILENVATAADVGTDNGLPPIGWGLAATVNSGGVHFTATIKNTDVSSRHISAYATVRGSEANTL